MLLASLLQIAAVLITAWPRQTLAQTTLAPLVSGCQPNCGLVSAASHWQWLPVSITDTVVYATVVYITNDDDGSVRTTTIFNEMPSGVSPPPTNAAGTQTAPLTIETALGEYTTLDLAYPTQLNQGDLSYGWSGTVPTYDAFDNFVCSTGNGSSALADFTAPITTVTTRTASAADPEGIFYTLWTYACVVPFTAIDAPSGNSNDGAIQYCTTGRGICGVSVVNTVQFLTETSSSRESKSKTPTTSKAATTSRAATSSSEPAIEPAPAAAPSIQPASTVAANPTTPSSSSTSAESTVVQEPTVEVVPTPPSSSPADPTPEPVQSSETPLPPESTGAQLTDQATPLAAPVVPSGTPSEVELSVEPSAFSQPWSGSTIEQAAPSPQTQIVTLELEVTGPGPTTTETVSAVTLVVTEQVTITKEGAVYVVSPGIEEEDATSAIATSTEAVGNAVAGGLGFNTGSGAGNSGSSSSSSSSSSTPTSAQQFPGLGTSPAVPMWLFELCMAFAVILYA